MRERMKNRLIKLLEKKYDHFCDQCGVNKDSHYTETLADYLLENGVIVPPCKVDDILFFILEDGEIGIFYLDGNAYVKKFQNNRKGTYLISLNKKYDPIPVTENSSFKIFGRVLS